MTAEKFGHGQVWMPRLPCPQNQNKSEGSLDSIKVPHQMDYPHRTSVGAFVAFDEISANAAVSLLEPELRVVFSLSFVDEVIQ